jgi:hypothetical protein
MTQQPADADLGAAIAAHEAYLDGAGPRPEWPTGGRPATWWLHCAGCGDTIFPAEHVYEIAAGHLCAVCETKRRFTGRVPEIGV